MLIAIGACKACGATSRQDYSLSDPAFAGGRAYRISPYGRKVTLATDYRCPACGQDGQWRGRVVKVSHSATPCDAKCTHATSAICNCQCGGANHGKAFLMCEALPIAA